MMEKKETQVSVQLVEDVVIRQKQMLSYYPIKKCKQTLVNAQVPIKAISA